jgi:hypothetical protein
MRQHVINDNEKCGSVIKKDTYLICGIPGCEYPFKTASDLSYHIHIQHPLELCSVLRSITAENKKIYKNEIYLKIDSEELTKESFVKKLEVENSETRL